jgi:hypothetical protein
MTQEQASELEPSQINRRYLAVDAPWGTCSSKAAIDLIAIGIGVSRSQNWVYPSAWWDHDRRDGP